MISKVISEYSNGRVAVLAEHATKSEAITIFESFPWDKELTKVKNGSGGLPTINFENDKNEKLKVWASKTDKFEVFFENSSSYSEFTVSNNYLNDNFSVEEVIELFYEDKLVEILQLIEKPFENVEEYDDTIIYDFKTCKKIKYLIWPLILPLIGFVFIFFTKWQPSNNPKADILYLLLMPFILILFWAPGFYLFFTFWQKNKNVKLIINPLDKSLVYIDKDNKEVIINKQNINECKYFISRRSGKFEYLKFILKDGKVIFVTCLLADPIEILQETGFKFKEIKTSFPTL